MGLEGLSTVGSVVFQLPSLSGKVRGCSRATHNFPNRLSSWERLGATLSLGYELTPLPVLSMRRLLAPYYCLCSGGDRLHLPASSLKCHWTALLPESSPALSVRWGRKSEHCRWECDSAHCLGMGKPGSRASRASCLIIQIRHVCTTPVPSQSIPLTCYCR